MTIIQLPSRLQRSRRKGTTIPAGAIYVGRPTRWGNPFRADRFGHARCVKLHRAWLTGHLPHPRLLALGFEEIEAEALRRWRHELLARLPVLIGHPLVCWCPLTTPWCHAETLLCLVNRPEALSRATERERLAA